MPHTESAGRLLAENHDLHLHSLYSDGWHGVEEVAGFALRWLEGERWVGISDHSPFLHDVIAQCFPGSDARDMRAVTQRILRTSPAGQAIVQQAIDERTDAYLCAAMSDRSRVREAHDATLLIGLEVEWCLADPAVSSRVLDRFDYVIAGYHGRALQTAGEAEVFLRRVIHHPHTDVIAHPDRFLGPFDVRRCNWPALFEEMARCHVLCEYNLTTPLLDDVLEVALATPGLDFVISSDTHDFRRRSQRRVLDAWAESEAGRFDLAREHLDGFVSDADHHDVLRQLYGSPAALSECERDLWARTRRISPSATVPSQAEGALLDLLDRDTSDARDRDFLSRRLARFDAVPSRVASRLPEREFRTLIGRNRSARRAAVESLPPVAI